MQDLSLDSLKNSNLIESKISLDNQIVNDAKFPRISVVTPSYNQGEFLEETIRSVLLQNYPNLEYIVIDGGSQDHSVAIIKKYEQYLSYWISEPDRGQSHALNKGLAKVTGDIFTFINSDDLLLPQALWKVAEFFMQHPLTWVVNGGHNEIDRTGNFIRSFNPCPVISWEDLVLDRAVQPQPGTFWRTSAFQKTGNFREDLHYYFDQEFFIRLLFYHSLATFNGPCACARIHTDTKSYRGSDVVTSERCKELLKWLPKIKNKSFTKLIAYRSTILLLLQSTHSFEQQNLFSSIFLALKYPVLLTSPTYLKPTFRRLTGNKRCVVF